jgi:uncharacterized protein HemY
MMRLLFAFILLLGSVYLGMQLHVYPGYLLVAFHHWTIETTLPFALLVLIILFLLLHGIWILIHKLAHIPSSWERYWERRRAQKKLAQERSHLLQISEQQCYLSSFKTLALQDHEQELRDLFSGLPRHLQQDPQILEIYIKFLLKKGQYAEAEALLRKPLRKTGDPDLMKLYSLCGESPKALKFAEWLLKKNGPSAPLCLCLGRLCMAQQLWGKAKEYIEQSIAIHPTPNAYMTLGLLHEARDEPQEACASFKQGLEESQ